MWCWRPPCVSLWNRRGAPIVGNERSARISRANQGVEGMTAAQFKVWIPPCSHGGGRRAEGGGERRWKGRGHCGMASLPITSGTCAILSTFSRLFHDNVEQIGDVSSRSLVMPRLPVPTVLQKTGQ